MLILTRRIGEAVKISDDITIRILEVQGNQVRLGIIAPREIAVHREEIYQKIQSKKDDDDSDETANSHLAIPLCFAS